MTGPAARFLLVATLFLVGGGASPLFALDDPGGTSSLSSPDGGDGEGASPLFALDDPGGASSASSPDDAAAQGDEFEGFDDVAGPAEAGAAPAATRDPLEGFNRAMFHFNDKLYFWALKPVARVYGWVVPKPARACVHRAFKNVKFPVRFVNSLLQGKWGGAGREGGRFLVNSTLGLAGLFDPAGAWLGWEPSDEDFGQTLGRWGVGAGVPITLPFLGPTNPRDLLGSVPDYYLNPLSYVDPHDPREINETRLWLKAADVVNSTSLDIGKYETVKKDALDPYAYLRDFQRSMRERQIKE